MVEVREMTRDEIAGPLARGWYGHLGLSHTKIGHRTRPSRVALYRLRPQAVYGRKTWEQ